MEKFPALIQTDGGESHNREVKQYLESKEINLFSTCNEKTEAAVVERCQKTLKSKVFKYIAFRGIFRFVDVLDKLVDSYNNTHHSNIETTPISVNKCNEKEIWSRLNKGLRKSSKRYEFEIGDYVRLLEFFRVRGRLKKERSLSRGFQAGSYSRIFLW